MDRLFLTLGGLLGATGVVAGAFGAHALKAWLAPDLLAVFDVGARYHLIHALAILATAWAVHRAPSPAARAAGWLFAGGTLLFSGSLYALALTGARGLGTIAPVGGVLLILGWLALAYAGWDGGRKGRHP